MAALTLCPQASIDAHHHLGLMWGGMWDAAILAARCGITSERKMRGRKRITSGLRLSDTTIRRANPGRHPDGGCLYLIVEPSKSKRWAVRVVVNGHRRDIGLGGLGTVSLSEAREKAQTVRKAAREGRDPIAALRGAGHRPSAPSFRAVATKVHAERAPTWKNGKHSDQWLSTLETYAFPVFGDTPVNAVSTPDVLKVLKPIWLDKPETARRLRQRLGVVFDWAKAHGHRDGDSPMSGVAFGLPKQTDAPEHMAALPYARVPEFITALRSCVSIR